MASSGAKPHFDKVFNLGVKTADIEAELKFLSAFNPDNITTVQFGPKQVPAVEIGGVRLMLMQTLSYDNDLPKPQPGGISHVSFMIEDLDELLAHLETQGVKPFKGPYEGSLGELGKRMVAMFRSPNGTMVSAIPHDKS